MNKYINFLLALLFVVSCSDLNIPNDDENSSSGDNLEEKVEFELSPDAIMLSDNFWQYIIEADESSITVSSSLPASLLPAVGRIICSLPNEKLPDGFMGRVTELQSGASGCRIVTEMVALDEAFSKLKLNKDIDVSKYVTSIIDENGEPVDFEVVSSEIFDHLSLTDGEEEDNTDSHVETKAPVGGRIGSCLELKLKNSLVSGKLYLNYTLGVMIDIEDGVNVCDFKLTTRSGVSGDLSIGNKEWNLSVNLFNGSIPLSPIPLTPVPLVLRPTLKASCDFIVKGEVGVTSSFQYEFERTTYDITYRSGKWDSKVSDLNESKENYFKLAELDLNGQFGMKESVGVQVGVFSDKVLGFGFNFSATQMFSTSIPFSLSIPGMLEICPSLTVTPQSDASLYCYARLFGKHLGRHEASVTLSSTVFEIPILPKFEVVKASKDSEGTRITSSVDFRQKSILATEESGLSLIKDGIGEPLQHNPITKGTKSVNSMDFSIDPEDNGMYYIAPYVVHGDKYYYGEKVPVERDIREVLMQLYEDTDGDNWACNDNWCSDKPVEEWYGVSRNESGMYSINLDRNNLRGRVDLRNCSWLLDLYLSNCEELKFIDVSGCSGLEKFYCQYSGLTNLNMVGCTSLTELNCCNNQLTELDVHEFVNLKRLSCGINNLGVLDVSGLSLLKSLDCRTCCLSSLDVSDLTSIERLGVEDNNLTSLDLHNKISLVWLICQNNKLSQLDVSGCTSLERIWCSKNNFTSIDVSGFSSLKDLSCGDNKLSYLDVSGCISLEKFWCFKNNLTSLDVSGLSALKELYCNGNKLSDLNVSGCTSIEELFCYQNNLTSLNISGLSSLKELSCQNNNITQEITPEYERIPKFSYDIRFVNYRWEDVFDDEGVFMGRVLLFDDLGKGWWYPGEPERGFHK